MWNLYHRQPGRRSFFWNGIFHSLLAFTKNLCSIVRNGVSTHFWLDNWVEGCASANIWAFLFKLAQSKEELIRDFSHKMVEVTLVFFFEM